MPEKTMPPVRAEDILVSYQSRPQSDTAKIWGSAFAPLLKGSSKQNALLLGH